MASGDLNNDGAVDVVTAKSLTTTVSVWLNNLAASTLTISVPDAVNLRTPAAGMQLTAQMGTATVVDNHAVALDWIATVASTNFATGTGMAPETPVRPPAHSPFLRNAGRLAYPRLW